MKKLREFLSALDLADLLFFGGLLLAGFGLSRIHDGLGLAVVGLLLTLYARPLSRWLK